MTTTMSALDAIYARHATRAYTADAVDDATIRTLLAGAVHAPTAMHLEPGAFVVVQDRELLRHISERGAALYWCRRYWIVRVLMPSISAAREVEPPVAFSVSRIA